MKREGFRLAPLPVKLGPCRVMRCTGCGELVEVIELPYQFLDPIGYVCGLCSTGGRL